MLYQTKQHELIRTIAKISSSTYTSGTYVYVLYIICFIIQML